MKHYKFFKHQAVILAFAFALIAGIAMPATPVEAAAKKPAKVKTISVKNINTTKATVTWSKSKGAKSYQVQVALDKKFKKSKKSYTVKATTRTITGLKANQKYFVRVRAKAKAYSKWSKTKTFKTAKKAAVTKPTAPAKPSKPTNDDNDKPIHDQSIDNPTPVKPTTCDHNWKYEMNMDSMATAQRYITGCGKDITDYKVSVSINGSSTTDCHGNTLVIDGKQIIWKASEYTSWGDDPDWFGIPCPYCHDYCGEIQLKTSSTIDELGVEDHTKRTCTKCGKVEISGKDFTNGEVTYE